MENTKMACISRCLEERSDFQYLNNTFIITDLVETMEIRNAILKIEFTVLVSNLVPISPSACPSSPKHSASSAEEVSPWRRSCRIHIPQKTVWRKVSSCWDCTRRLSVKASHQFVWEITSRWYIGLLELYLDGKLTILKMKVSRIRYFFVNFELMLHTVFMNNWIRI